MDEYKKFLATKVLNEDVIINYRQLSRALKVHTHLAKQMLYDFHNTTNAKKPGTVHATYLLTGILQTDTQPPSQPTHSLRPQDEDTPMESSPFPSSLPDAEPGPSFESEDAEPADEPVHNTTVMLVREEEIEEAKAEFEELQTIFVYSLEPGPLKDFQLLAQCNREVTKEFWTEDPLEAYPKYGLITNKDVRRRTGKRPPPPPPPAASTQPAKAAATASAKASQPAAATSVKKEDKPAPDPTGRSAPPAKPAASLKRQSSDLFKSFAKSKPPKLKTADSNATSASASANQSPVDKDAEMQGMSEDEDDEPPEEVDEEAAAKEAENLAEARKARKEREEKLRAMMDEDDEDEEMADAGAETPAEEADKDEGALDPPQEPEKTEEVTVSDGRRRGRRKVMKKRTYKDEDGYLVTKEEAAWESFSEDEPEPKKPKMAPVQVKKKAGPAPKGQGSLMNFFKKK